MENNTVKSVLIVLKHLDYGGMERYTLNLANALVDKGISVTVISGDGPLSNRFSPKVNLFILPISRNPRIKQITEKRILEIASICKPQIIHTQCRMALVCSQLARKTLNIPVVTHEHRMYADSDAYPYIVNELRECADKIIAIGPYTARELIKYGLNNDRIVPILNGVNPKAILPITPIERKLARESLRLNGSDKVIVCLSRFDPSKGIDKLATGFIKIAQRIPQAKLLLVGDDKNDLVKPFIKKIIRDNGLHKKIFVFKGAYDIRKYHAIADIFCYPPLAKGMAVMEAMAAGLAVVGKETDRKPLVVEDKISGLMTKMTVLHRIDPDEIADKLTFLLNNPELAKQMGAAARNTITERFNVENNTSKVMSVYHEMINETVPEMNSAHVFETLSIEEVESIGQLLGSDREPLQATQIEI